MADFTPYPPDIAMRQIPVTELRQITQENGVTVLIHDESRVGFCITRTDHLD